MKTECQVDKILFKTYNQNLKGVSVLSKERLTVADEDLGNGMKRRHIIDGNEVRKYAMHFYWRLKEYEDLEDILRKKTVR